MTIAIPSLSEMAPAIMGLVAAVTGVFWARHIAGTSRRKRARDRAN